MAEEPTSNDDPPNDVVASGHRLYRDSLQHSSEWRAEARNAYDMASCRQWTEEDAEQLEDQKRVPTVIDRIGRTLNAVAGTQVNNRQETRYIPREMGDVAINEVLTGAADWVRDQCDAEDEESDAFYDMMVTGLGVTETYLDYAEDAEGKVLIERRDPLNFYWDPGATKRNLSDSKRHLYLSDYDPDEFDLKWPKAGPNLSGAPWDGSDDLNRRRHKYPQDAYKEQQDRSGKTIGVRRVGQYLYAVNKKMLRVGPGAEMVPDNRKLRKKLEEEGIQFIRQEMLVWRRAFICGNELLEDEEAPCPYTSSFKPMTYRRDRNKNLWFGLVRQMSDPQKFGNKFFSLYLDILAKNAKGGIMAEKDAVEDPRAFEETWAKPDGVAWVNSGAISGQKITNKPAVNFPAGIDRMMMFALDNVHEGTGINLELLGMANREQAGVLENQRKQAGVTIIAPLFDGLRRYRKEQGRLLLHMIQTYLSDGRLVKILSKGQEKYIPLLRDQNTAKFDVIVDEAPTSPNMKERVFGALSELMPALAKVGVPMPPSLLDYAPIPSALAAEWKEHIQKTSGVSPEQMQEAQKQMQKLQQENQDLRLKKEEKMLELQMDQQKMGQEMAIEREKMQLEREKALIEIEIERAKLELEKQKAGVQLQIANQKAATDIAVSQQGMQLERDRAASEMDLKNRELEQTAKREGYQVALKSPDFVNGIHKVLGEFTKTAGKKRKRKFSVQRDAKGELVGGVVEDE